MDFKNFENNVQSYTGALKDKLLVINGSTVALNTKVTGTQAHIVTLQSDLSDVSNRLDDCNFALTKADEKINSSISAIKTDVSTLRQYVDEQIETQASGITIALNTVDSSISSIKSDVSALNSSINSWVASHTTSYNALVTADTQINSSINSIKATIGNATDASTAATLYGMIKALKEMLEENELVTAQALVDLDARLIAGNL